MSSPLETARRRRREASETVAGGVVVVAGLVAVAVALVLETMVVRASEASTMKTSSRRKMVGRIPNYEVAHISFSLIIQVFEVNSPLAGSSTPALRSRRLP